MGGIPNADIKSVGEPRERKNLRLHESDAKRFEAWAEKEGMSFNEFAAAAMNQYIDIKLGNYPLQTLEQQRLNQLIDEIRSMREDYRSMSSIVLSSMDSLTQLANGANILYDQDDV